MNMDSQIRVRTNVRYSQLYNDLKGIVCTDAHELFFICACLGYKRGTRKPLSGSGEEKFWSNTITPHEWACYYTMLLANTSPDLDYSVVEDDKKVIAQMEEYANAGMELLISELLSDYLVSKATPPKLDSMSSKDLVKGFVYFVYLESGLVFGKPI